MALPEFVLQCYMLSGRQLNVMVQRDYHVHMVLNLMRPYVEELVGQRVNLIMVQGCFEPLVHSTLEQLGISEHSEEPYVNIVATVPVRELMLWEKLWHEERIALFHRWREEDPTWKPRE